MNKRTASICKHLFLIILAAAILLPLIYTVASSFKTNSEIMAHPERIFPAEPTLDNYKQVWDSSKFSVKHMLWNSIYYTVANVFITLVLSSMGGYVFARGHFPGKKVIFTVFCSLLFVNLGTIVMHPYFQVLMGLGIDRGLPSLLLIKCFGIPVANFYLVRSFISRIPYEIDEAAKIDGCSFGQIFFKIILFMLQPILATIAILTFQASWNDYMMPMIFTMTKPLQRTLIVGVVALKSTGEAASSWNLMLAGTTVSLLPVLVIYIVCNKYFVEGIASGAVKG